MAFDRAGKMVRKPFKDDHYGLYSAPDDGMKVGQNEGQDYHTRCH